MRQTGLSLYIIELHDIYVCACLTESAMIIHRDIWTENFYSRKNIIEKPQNKCPNFSGEMGILETENEETRSFWDQRNNWLSRLLSRFWKIPVFSISLVGEKLQ